MVPHFHDLEGGVFVYAVSTGVACGGHVATIHFRPGAGDADRVRAVLERVLLDDVGRQPLVASAHLLEPSTPAPSDGGATPEVDGTCVLLVEAVAPDGIGEALAALDPVLADGVADDAPRIQRWQLMYMLTRD